MKLFTKAKKKVLIDDNVVEKKNTRKITFDEVVNFIQEDMLKNSYINNVHITYDEKQHMLSLAMARDKDAILKVKDYIETVVKLEKINVEGYTRKTLVDELFSKNWGLDSLEKYANDEITDEIRVNSKDSIYIVQNGVSEKLDFKFESEEEIENLIKRMIVEDIGTSIDMSNPKLEAILLDGSRLTATCPPITKSWTFIIRRSDSFRPTLENYINKKTLNNKVWEAVSLLARGRASMLFSGNVGAGKTTFMRKVIGELHKKLRIGVIGKDNEILLAEEYPERDIIEMEEKEHLGILMKDLFILMLRESPDVLVVEEFRGGGEAIEAVRACTRALGSMATAHFNTAEEAIEGTALFMLEEGLSLPIEMAKLRVARAFDIIIQMVGNSVTGEKIVIGITEIYVDEDGNIKYNELMKWKPYKIEDYYGMGKWVFTNKPTERLAYKLIKNVGEVELLKMGWL